MSAMWRHWKLNKCQNNDDIASIYFADFVHNDTDRVLWDFFSQLTMSEKEYKRFLEREGDANCILDVDSLKLTQRLSLLAIAAFIYSCGECHMPITMLLTDVIDKHTKSRECKEILHRFGVCVTPRCFDEFQASWASERRENIKPEILYGSFGVVSFDNINKRARHARVTSISTKRGFDGTSLVACFPRPSSIEINDAEKTLFYNVSMLDTRKNAYVLLQTNALR